MTEIEQLRYPIGKFDCPKKITKGQIESWISILEHFPDRLEQLVSNLTDEQLDTVYRSEENDLASMFEPAWDKTSFRGQGTFLTVAELRKIRAQNRKKGGE